LIVVLGTSLGYHPNLFRLHPRRESISAQGNRVVSIVRVPDQASAGRRHEYMSGTEGFSTA
jgi:hypothetical protein